MIRYTVALIFASLMPCVLGIGGWLSASSAVILGAFFLYSEFLFARTGATHQARQVLRMSLLFLPAQFLLMVLDAISERMIGY